MSSLDLNSLKDNPNYLVVDSYKVVKKFVDFSKLEPVELYIRKDLLDETLKDSFPVIHELKSNDFESIPGTKFHKGVVGVFRKDISLKQPLIPPFVILNGVTSPENVGSIVRTISGLDFKTIVLDKKSASPLLRRAIRVSMGNIVFLNILVVDDLKDFIPKCEFPIYASGNEPHSISFFEWEPKRESGFIIGSEGHGIDKEIYNLCESTVRIPVRDEVQHLNAGHSCAILASKYLLNTSK